MIITIIRTVLLYASVIIAVRLMGKRQIGDMQPSELVITLIIADIASLPMEDVSRPMLSGLIPTLVLVSCEIILSVIMMKNSKFRKVVCGSPVMIIEDGKLLQDKMKSLRITVEDLCIQLRQLGVFALEDVQYCIAETNGKISVLQKPDKRNPTAEDLGIEINDSGLEVVVISDGRFLDTSIRLCNTDAKNLNKILKKNKTTVEDVFIMTYNRSGKYNIIQKQI